MNTAIRGAIGALALAGGVARAGPPPDTQPGAERIILVCSVTDQGLSQLPLHLADRLSAGAAESGDRAWLSGRPPLPHSRRRSGRRGEGPDQAQGLPQRQGFRRDRSRWRLPHLVRRGDQRPGLGRLPARSVDRWLHPRKGGTPPPEGSGNHPLCRHGGRRPGKLLGTTGSASRRRLRRGVPADTPARPHAAGHGERRAGRPYVETFRFDGTDAIPRD